MTCKYNQSGWDGTLPRRRYAMMSDNQLIVVYDTDIEHAPSWSNFVRWFGSEKLPLKIDVHFHCDSLCGCGSDCPKQRIRFLSDWIAQWRAMLEAGRQV